MKILYFDFLVVSKKCRNTATMIVASFIINVFFLRGNNAPECLIKSKIKATILRDHRYVKEILKIKINKFFTTVILIIMSSNNYVMT